jgi:hypothetical protein
MSSPELEKLVTTGQLKPEAFAQDEFDGLVQSGKARLIDAAKKSLALESRFDLAYNASHAFALAALRRKGYRSENRYIVFQILPYTLGLPLARVKVLTKAHGTRNASEYEGYLEADLKFVEELVSTVEAVRKALEAAQSS